MKQTIRQFSLLFGGVAGALVLAVAPVGAEHGSNTSTSTSGDSSGTTSGRSSTEIAQSPTNENETEATQTETGSGTDSLKDQAERLLTSQRQNGKEHSTEQRQKACEQRQKSLDTRHSNFTTAAQRHLDVFNKIFTKVQAFHDSKQLTVANYDQLVATATAKQSAAQAAVDALKGLSSTIDCTQPDPAASVAKLKSAVADARMALQAYRAAIKDVIVALQGASTSTTKTSDSTGSNQ